MENYSRSQELFVTDQDDQQLVLKNPNDDYRKAVFSRFHGSMGVLVDNNDDVLSTRVDVRQAKLVRDFLDDWINEMEKPIHQ